MTPVPLRAHRFATDPPVIHRGGFISPALESESMQGIIRASARLLVMGFVMAAVLVAAVVAGVGTTTAIAIGIVLAGVAGIAMHMRRSDHKMSAHDEIAAMMAEPKREAAPPAVSPTQATSVEAMAPQSTQPIDPEANMPRWRRPSLLEARYSDPTRQAPVYRQPMSFSDDEARRLDVRVVRYAVVPMLDRPDEVLGHRVCDLEHGDQVQVISASGTFVEVKSAKGDHGWVHRTTISQSAPAAHAPTSPYSTADADDALTALLSARGLI
jgi:hypothetical protein